MKKEVRDQLKILGDLLADVADFSVANEISLKSIIMTERTPGFTEHEPCERRIKYAIDNLKKAKKDLEKVYSALPPDKPHKLDAPLIKIK